MEGDESIFKIERLSEVLPQEEQKSLLSSSRSTGLVNLGVDCFFNSAVQLIFHSFLYSYLLNETSLADTEESRKFLLFFKELALQYKLASEENARFSEVRGNSFARYSTKEMRDLLDFHGNGQEDAAEAFRRIISFYALKNVTSNFFRCKSINLSNKVVISGFKNIEEYSELNEHGTIEKPEEHIMVPLSLAESATKFQEMVNSLFEWQVMESEYFFREKGEVYKVNSFKERLRLDSLQKGLFFQVKRFVFDQDKKAYLKNSHKVLLEDGKCKIGEDTYELKAFVVHIGSEPNEGHYICYCNISEGWLCFDDQKKPQELHQRSALKNAEEAYILYFERLAS